MRRRYILPVGLGPFRIACVCPSDYGVLARHEMAFHLIILSRIVVSVQCFTLAGSADQCGQLQTHLVVREVKEM